MASLRMGPTRTAAARAAQLIPQAGVPVRLDDRRGFDHGAFVPLFVTYPEAQTPLFGEVTASSYRFGRYYRFVRY
jgi:aromatic ring-opening dioxygenase catalytic subunit (LigB family)